MVNLQRSGLWTLRQLAYKLCQLIPKFTPAIKRAFPDATSLHDALDAVNLACAVLVSEADEVLPEGT